MEDRKGHDLRYSVDTTKIRRELGYAPRHDFDTGLAETVRWYRERGDWWRPAAREGLHREVRGDPEVDSPRGSSTSGSIPG